MTHYIVREHINSDNPSDEGPELKRFSTWNEAREYSDQLWLDDGIKSYISEEIVD